MADFEYVDVNGRQIRVRPRETAQEIDEYGNFHRQPNRFTEAFGEGKNPVEKDRPGRESWMGICKFPGSYQSGNGRTVLK